MKLNMSDINKDDLLERINDSLFQDGLRSPSDSFSTSRYGRARKPRFTNGDFYCSDEVLSPLLTHDTISLSPTKKMSPSSPKSYYNAKKVANPELCSPVKKPFTARSNETTRLDIDEEESEKTESIFHIDNDYSSLLKIVSRPSGSPNESLNGTIPKPQVLKTYSNRKKLFMRFDSEEENSLSDIFPKCETFSWIESVPEEIQSHNYKPLESHSSNSSDLDINLKAPSNDELTTCTDILFHINGFQSPVLFPKGELRTGPTPNRENIIKTDTTVKLDNISQTEKTTTENRIKRKKKNKKNVFNINRWKTEKKENLKNVDNAKKRGRKKRCEDEKKITNPFFKSKHKEKIMESTVENDSDNEICETKYDKSSKIIQNQKFKVNVNQEIEVKGEDGKIKKFKIGDIIWARLGKYPFWPAIIVENKELKSIFKTTNLYKREEKVLSVQFFGDCGRCSWVPSYNSFIFEGRKVYENLVNAIPSSIKKKDPRLWNGFLIPKTSLRKWLLAVSEAETLLPKNILDRFEYFDQLVKEKRRNIKKKQIENLKKEKIELDIKVNVKKEKEDESANWETITEENPGVKVEKVDNTEPKSDFHTSTPIKISRGDSRKKLEKKNRKKHRRYPSRPRQLVDRYNSLLVDLEYKKPKETIEEKLIKEEKVDKDTSFEDCNLQSPELAKSSESTDKILSYEPNKRLSLFKGAPKERICQICEKPRNAFKCQGTCLQYFHTKCIRNPEKFSRANKYKDCTPLYDIDSPESSSDSEEDSSNVKIEEIKNVELSLADQIDAKLEEVMKDKVNIVRYCEGSTDDSMDSEDRSGCNTPDIPFHVTGDSIVSESDKEPQNEFKCRDCRDNRLPACHACGLYDLENNVRQKCIINQCGRYYHPECLKGWPQTQWTTSAKLSGRASTSDQIKSLTCPSHVCHTCVSDDPRGLQGRYIKEKLAKCIRCPTSYHISNYCIPAGTEILSANQIVCPKHFACYNKYAKFKNRKSIHHVNASWCFICAVGGSLICCETCPTSFHAECLKISPPEGSFICEECETGRLPLYDEVVWVKLGIYRWWPAKILFPDDVPDNIKSIKHNVGEFAVQFFGSHDYYWVNRGRVFLYQEGDSGNRSGKKSMHTAFIRAMEEAAIAFKNMKVHRETREAESWPSMKPPSYVRIKTNRPVGNIKSGESHNSMTPCTCDPTAVEPCGVDSDCLNRIMLTECNPEICPAGKNCCNQAFEKREYPAMVPFRTAGRGWGLKTLVPLIKGQFVIEYVGEIINEEEYQNRLKRMHERKDENYYFLTIDRERMLDAGPKGNVARFMNHSCQPNCVTQKWTVNGDTRVGLFALQDIAADTELTFNYNLECIGKEKKICKCGAPNCSGFIGLKAKNFDEKEKPEEVKKKRFFSAKILKKINAVLCFICGKKDSEGRCPLKNCLKGYHLACVDLKKWPKEAWKCPRHKCVVCFRKKNLNFCEKCIKSYCQQHSDGSLDKIEHQKFVCKNHQSDLPETSQTNISSSENKRLSPAPSEVRSEFTIPEDLKAMKRKRRHTIQNDEPLSSKSNNCGSINNKLNHVKLSLKKKDKINEENAHKNQNQTSKKVNQHKAKLKKYSLPIRKKKANRSGNDHKIKKTLLNFNIKNSTVNLVDCLNKQLESKEFKNEDLPIQSNCIETLVNENQNKSILDSKICETENSVLHENVTPENSELVKSENLNLTNNSTKETQDSIQKDLNLNEPNESFRNIKTEKNKNAEIKTKFTRKKKKKKINHVKDKIVKNTEENKEINTKIDESIDNNKEINEELGKNGINLEKNSIKKEKDQVSNNGETRLHKPRGRKRKNCSTAPIQKNTRQKLDNFAKCILEKINQNDDKEKDNFVIKPIVKLNEIKSELPASSNDLNSSFKDVSVNKTKRRKSDSNLQAKDEENQTKTIKEEEIKPVELNENINSNKVENVRKRGRKRRGRKKKSLQIKNSDVGNNNVGDLKNVITIEEKLTDSKIAIVINMVTTTDDNNLNENNQELNKPANISLTNNINETNQSKTKKIEINSVINGNISVDSELEISSTNTDQSLLKPVKRSRGRPRKRPLILNSSITSNESPQVDESPLSIHHKKRKFYDNIENADNKHIKLMNGHSNYTPEKIENGICPRLLRNSLKSSAIEEESKTDFLETIRRTSDNILKSNECHLPIRKRAGLRSMDFSNTCENMSV